MDAQARTQALFRSKLKAQKKEKRLDSPLVRYNESDQPVCRVCNVALNSESQWDAHQASHKHHEAIDNPKANAARATQASNVKPGLPSKFFDGHVSDTMPNAAKGTQASSAKMGLPPKFFDDHLSKTQVAEMGLGFDLEAIYKNRRKSLKVSKGSGPSMAGPSKASAADSWKRKRDNASEAVALATERASRVIPMHFNLGPDWREAQEKKHQERDAKLARFGEDLIPREPGWLIHEDQNLMDEEDAKEMALELWKGSTTARTLECYEHSFSNLNVALSRLVVLSAQVSGLSGWVSQTIQAMVSAKSQAEQRATQAIAVVAKLIQRVYHYEQLLRVSQSASMIALPDEGVQEELGSTEAEQLANAEAAFLSTVKANKDKERDLQARIIELQRENAKWKVDFENMKNHTDIDMKDLREENKKLRGK